MSEKQFEECSLEDATHIELGGKVHKLGSGIVHKRICFGSYHGITVCYDEWREQNSIYTGVFPVLGIKPMRERKRKPRECMALTVIAQRFGKDVVALLPTDDFELGMTVRCVEILEDEK